MKNMRTYIIRCSDGWMKSYVGDCIGALEIALAHVAGTDLTYVIV